MNRRTSVLTIQIDGNSKKMSIPIDKIGKNKNKNYSRISNQLSQRSHVTSRTNRTNRSNKTNKTFKTAKSVKSTASHKSRASNYSRSSNKLITFQNEDSVSELSHDSMVSAQNFIENVARLEDTPELSSVEQSEDSLRIHESEEENDKPNTIEGIEYMLQRLQLQAKEIEESRYSGKNEIKDRLLLATLPKAPNDVKHKNKKSKINQSHFNRTMNWWDEPFKDHLHEAKRPIIREAGIEQFASEYMLAQLRDSEERLLQMRQSIENERVRQPLNNWYEFKDQRFSSELKRANRILKK